MLARQYTAFQYQHSLLNQLEINLKLAETATLIMPIPLHTFLIGRSEGLYLIEIVIKKISKHLKKNKLWITDPDTIINFFKSRFSL